MATGVPFSNTPISSKVPPFLRSAPFGEARLSRLHALLDSLGGILWLPNQHNYTLLTDTAVAPGGDPVGYIGSHRQNLPENYVKNSMMVGAGGVSGSPDLLSFPTTPNNGVTLSFNGTGTDSDGVYCEFSMSGTDAGGATKSSQINPNGGSTGTDHPIVALHQLWSGQIKVKGVSGTQRQMTLRLREVDADGTTLGTDATVNITPTNGTATSFNKSKVIVNSTVARLRYLLQFAVAAGSGTWDNVFRIYAPQLERGKPTVFTPTYGTAISRGNFECAWQDTTAAKPILDIDADGKSILTFDGLQTFLRTGIQTPEAAYIAGVWNLTGAAGAAYGMFASSAGTTFGARQGARFIRDSTNKLNMSRDDNTATIVLASTADYLSGKAVIDAHYAVASASLRKNGGDEVTSATARTATSTNYFRIGASGNGEDSQTAFFPGAMNAKVYIPGTRPGATTEAEIRRLLAEITAVSGVV